MWLVAILASVALLCLVTVLWLRRRREQGDLERHGISPQDLRSLQSSGREVLIFDVRQPLDLLAYPEIIPGAKRIPPQQALEQTLVIPRDKDAVLYCTCPSDKTSRDVLHRALGLEFRRIRFLRGGLAAWKSEGFPVEAYTEAFNLYTPTAASPGK